MNVSEPEALQTTKSQMQVPPRSKQYRELVHAHAARAKNSKPQATECGRCHPAGFSFSRVPHEGLERLLPSLTAVCGWIASASRSPPRRQRSEVEGEVEGRRPMMAPRSLRNDLGPSSGQLGPCRLDLGAPLVDNLCQVAPKLGAELETKSASRGVFGQSKV